MDNNSPQNGNSFDAENQENNNENKKIGVRPNLRLLQTPKLKIIFITLFIFVVLLLSIHINNNYGKFTKGPDLI